MHGSFPIVKSRGPHWVIGLVARLSWVGNCFAKFLLHFPRN